MSKSITIGNTVTMSSREIAELVGKQHAHVLRDIRGMLEALKDDPVLDHVREDKDVRGYTACVHLNRELTELLLTGYSIPLRLKVIRRLNELEQSVTSHAPAIPQNFSEALRLAADLAEQNAKLAVANLEQASKIDALQSLFHEGQSPAEFCKKLNGVNVMQVCSVLEGRGWLFNESKSGVRWRVASYARDRYLTEHQQRIAPHGQEAFIRHTPVLLRKGAEKLFDLYLKCELPMKKSWDGLYTHDKAARGVA